METKVRIINKYPNRRLYDTEESRYIKLSEIRALIENGEQIKVVDSKTKEDITRSILLQIIMEQESNNEPLFSNSNLEDFIRYYSENSREAFGMFMGSNLKFFQEQQETIQRQMQELMELSPLDFWREATNRNIDLWRKMQDNFMGSPKGRKK